MSAPPTPTTTTEKGASSGFTPLVAVVDFHHARGPEVETWFGVEEGRDPAAEYDWTLLPFMALSDGAHALTEDFSYFTLLRPAITTASPNPAPATSLFGISCTRQMDAAQLLVRPPDVTRSTVQKAVVVIADSPQYFGVLRERLSVVTKAWFAQREFTDVEILRRFQESLADEKARGLMHEDEDRDQYLGLSLRELVREFRWQTLVLLKCCLLQPKFSLISLIPGLLRNLQDSAGPELDSYEKSLTTPTSLRTSDRNSLLSYMGLPLQIFGKGSLFGPYTPLQQLDILADFGTKSYIVGSTNSLLLQQKDRYSDILINLDEGTINITSPSLKAALQLSTPDRRWIDFITQNVNDTWDDANPSRPKTMGYVGSEEFIRVQFEEYLLSLIASVKYRAHLAKHAHNPRIMLLPDIEGDPSTDFGPDFIDAWTRTENHRLWAAHTDSHLFDIIEPRHPCAGGLTIDDIQRRITQQVQDLHWDERFAVGKEVLGRNLAAGREKASTLFNKLYADMEGMREAQRRKNEEARAAHHSNHNHNHNPAGDGQHGEKNGTATTPAVGVDLAKAQQTMQAVGSKAGAFVNSWAAWAGEKRRAAAAGWGKSSTTTSTTTNSSSSGGDNTPTSPSGTSSGWGASWGRAAGSKNRTSQAPAAAPTLSNDAATTTTTTPSVEKSTNRTSISSLPFRNNHNKTVEYSTADPESRPLNRNSGASISTTISDRSFGLGTVASTPTTTATTTATTTSVHAPGDGSATPTPALSSSAKTNGTGTGARTETETETANVPAASAEKVGEVSPPSSVHEKKKNGKEEEEEEEASPSPHPNAATDDAAEAKGAWETTTTTTTTR
ncbi:hypothetical protein NEMBOFW57_006460 [Staphylotrichum longicolle]|uniref:UDENN domain-containing protein n=1 Tax=Staphylotrichum longicolle TaxID=669026 RepID=A0AAD4ETA5_9PEZI|nr:hypothetical protein NEMBOFW57_006460 [Staphylotrichum longicolle]